MAERAFQRGVRQSAATEQAGYGEPAPVDPPPPKRKRGKPPGGSLRAAEGYEWGPVFIDAIMRGLSINAAARAAGVSSYLPYQRRKTDKNFEAAWREAATIGTEILEQEAQRRAFHGTRRPVFHRGVRVGSIREYSDTLMMFVLKQRDPTYREGGDRNGGGAMQLNVQVAVVDGRPVAQVSHTGEGSGANRQVPVNRQVAEGDGRHPRALGEKEGGIGATPQKFETDSETVSGDQQRRVDSESVSRISDDALESLLETVSGEAEGAPIIVPERDNPPPVELV